MPRSTVIINQSHYKGNGVFLYEFPNTVRFDNAKISLYSLAMYNSTFNIKSSFGNNTLSITWIDGTTINLTIPDGYYSYDNINTFIQNACNANFWYLSPVTASNSAVYFITTTQNSSRYAGQVNVFAVPTSAQASGVFIKPTGASWSYPVTPKTPTVTFSAGLGKIFGFKNQLTFPATSQASNFSAISDTTPIISPIYSYLVSCNLLNSDLSLFNQLFFQVPINAPFGGLINFTNPQSQALDVHNGTYKNLILYFYDQTYAPLTILDTEVTLILIIDY
jgi:hypothetical protein